MPIRLLISHDDAVSQRENALYETILPLREVIGNKPHFVKHLVV